MAWIETFKGRVGSLHVVQEALCLGESFNVERDRYGDPVVRHRTRMTIFHPGVWLSGLGVALAFLPILTICLSVFDHGASAISAVDLVWFMVCWFAGLLGGLTTLISRSRNPRLFALLVFSNILILIILSWLSPSFDIPGEAARDWISVYSISILSCGVVGAGVFFRGLTIELSVPMMLCESDLREKLIEMEFDELKSVTDIPAVKEEPGVHFGCGAPDNGGNRSDGDALGL